MGERIDRVEFESEGVERACPRIDTVLPDGSKLAVIAEVGPKRGGYVGRALVT